ncbi:MAG TPA: hypothetical protein VK543_12085 [Puia sp.]|nr:hypothetical protein [Puia sp.]
MTTHTKFVRKDTWCTLEIFWNSHRQLHFVRPANSKIRVKYGPGWFSAISQLQMLDGTLRKTLTVGRWSVFMAKVQINSSTEDYISYTC